MILESPISLEVISTFRGVVDFYKWKGLNVARAWPRRPNQPNSPAQLFWREGVRQMAPWIKSNPLSWHRGWLKMPYLPGRTNEDMKRKYFLRMYRRGIVTRPPDVVSATHCYNYITNKTTFKLTARNYTGFDWHKFRWAFKAE